MTGGYSVGIVAVVPVFNERHTVLSVLEGIERHGIGAVIVIDDGSTDGSTALLDEWAMRRPFARVIHFPRNRGKSAALRAAADYLRADLEGGLIDADALVVCIDADGQHDPAFLGPLIERSRALPADLVIARRDLGYHGRYKRFGNAVMAGIGSFCSGAQLQDIESGYRVIRLGPLLHAQQYYAGHRYSEAVEQAVVLARLGYSVDNDYLTNVPVSRTRTRLHDAFRHAGAMFATWYRVACWKHVVPARRSALGVAASVALIAAFVAFLAIISTHRLYLGNDSAQSYAHVWFLEQALFSGHGIPLRMPNLEAGRAFTLPYAALPWLPTALARPLLGDVAVTASMVLGVALLVTAIWKWLPRTATPLLSAMMLLNPQLWNGVAQFQLPTVWAFAFACFSAASFNRSRPWRATALAVAALVAHPLAGAVGLLCTLLARCEEERRLPLHRVAALAFAAVLASPALWMFMRTPLIGEVGYAALITPTALTLRRISMLAWPWACQRFMPVTVRLHAPLLTLGVVFVAWNLAISNPSNLWEHSQPRFADFIEAGMLDRHATYRVLTLSHHEDGMVQLMQAGAVLAQEFFDESIQRRSFGDTDSYRCFLASKHADHVLVSAEWTARGYTDELRLLDVLVDEGHAVLAFRGSAGTLDYAIQPPPTCPGSG